MFKSARHPNFNVESRKTLFLILTIGAAFRLWGITHGYPYSYYPDEAHFVSRSLSFGSGDFNPHWFHKPAFFMYFLFFEYGLLFILGKILSYWNTVTDYAVFYILNPGPFYLIGRITVTAFSLGTIFVTCLTAEKLFNRKTGIISALILAVLSGHVMVAKDIKADVPCAFFTLVSVYYLICYIKNNLNKDIIWSSIFAGIGTATKSYSIVMLLPIAIALITSKQPVRNYFLRSIRLFSLCILVFYATYFICSPYNFIDPTGRKATFGKIVSLMKKVEHVISGEDEYKRKEYEKLDKDIYNPEISFAVYRDGIIDYINQLSNGVGTGVLVLSFLGVLFFFINRTGRPVLLFCIFPVIFIGIAVFMHPGYSEIRHQVVVYPFLTIAAAYFVMDFAEKRKLPNLFLFIFIAIFLIEPTIASVKHNLIISREDTRNIAKKWIEANIDPDTKILLDEDCVKLLKNEKSIKENLNRIKKLLKEKNSNETGPFTAHYDKYIEYQIMASKKAIAYNIQEIRLPWWRDKDQIEGVHLLTSEFDKDMGNHLRPVGVESYEYYQKNGFSYAIVHSIQYSTFIKDTVSSKNFPWFTLFYRNLFKKGKLVKKFASDKNRPLSGPEIRIYSISSTIREN